jgi:hypothetical protein
MKIPNRISIGLIALLATASSFSARNHFTIAHGNWDGNDTWNEPFSQEAPDTIFIRHYITFSADLNMVGPTVIIIEKEGVLCGDAALDMACGAKLLNRGKLFINTLRIKSGVNTGQIFYRNFLINSCGNGNVTTFANSLNGGSIGVWNDSFCKTEQTGWQGETNTGIHTRNADADISITPNPILFDQVTVRGPENMTITLVDPCGRLLENLKGSFNLVVELKDYPSGIYYLTIESEGRTINRKILKN